MTRAANCSGTDTVQRSRDTVTVLSIIRKLGTKLGSGERGGGGRGGYREVTSVCVAAGAGAGQQVVLADTRILVFDLDTGDYVREFGWRTLKEGGRGRYQV